MNPMAHRNESPKRRAPLHLIATLEKALKSAKMEGASFAFPNERIRIVSGMNNGFEESIDGFIKGRTRLYRESWLIPEIEDALEWARGES